MMMMMSQTASLSATNLHSGKALSISDATKQLKLKRQRIIHTTMHENDRRVVIRSSLFHTYFRFSLS
jgi:hypothetical protein